MTRRIFWRACRCAGFRAGICACLQARAPIPGWLVVALAVGVAACTSLCWLPGAAAQTELADPRADERDGWARPSTPPPTRRAAAPVHSAHPWGPGPFTYLAANTPLPELFRDFASQYGIDCVIDRAVSGVINGRLSAPSAAAFLDRITADHGLDWFYAKGTLHLGRRAQRVSQRVDLQGRPMSEALRVLSAAGMFQPRFAYLPMSREGAMMVSAPRAYIELVRAHLRALWQADETAEFGLFLLKHARVEDRTIRYRDQQIHSPGIARLLQSLLGVERSGSAPPEPDALQAKRDEALTRVARDHPSAFSSLSAQSDFAVGSESMLNARTPPAEDASERQWDAPHARQGIQVVADPRLNAIIVRGPKSLIDASRSLLEKLDVPVPLVQIEAAIIELSEAASEKLGVNWSLRTPWFALETGAATGAAAGGAAAGISTLISDRGKFFAQINALQESGDARVITRPSVLTLSNSPAVLDLSSTEYILNASERVALTTPVQAGLLLQIVPGVFQQAGHLARVSLDIKIEDGKIQQPQGKKTPTVQKAEISTRAVVLDSQTLLIAGHQMDSSRADENGVPGLSKVPWLGRLFGSTAQGTTRLRRYVLITPKVVDPDSVPVLEDQQMRGALETPLTAPRGPFKSLRHEQGDSLDAPHAGDAPSSRAAGSGERAPSHPVAEGAEATEATEAAERDAIEALIESRAGASAVPTQPEG